MTVYLLRDPGGLYWQWSDRFTNAWITTQAGATQFPNLTSAALARIEHDLPYVDVLPVDDEQIDA